VQLVRASEQHEDDLRSFACTAREARFGVQDIECDVRSGKALRRSFQHPEDRFALIYIGGDLAACAYHQPWPGFGVEARFLMFVALHDQYQGSLMLDRGCSLASHVIGLIADDVRDCDPTAVVLGGHVHADNERCMRLLDAQGWQEDPLVGGYVRRTILLYP